MSVLITANNIELEYPSKRVFDKISFGINDGLRLGIVGKNGDGKSSLLALIYGNLKPDAGEVIMRSHVACGLLMQDDNMNDSDSVSQAVFCDMDTHEWASNRKTREILDNLIGDINWNSLIGELSGGQRRRCDLARLLIRDWDVLLLDEPSNHLDIKTIKWLASHLKSRWTSGSGALVLVTHDRWLLDEVCTSTVEVHDGKLDFFEGGYSAYILARVERDRVTRVRNERRRNLARKELAWLSRGARARSTKPKFHVARAMELIDSDEPIRKDLELKKAAMSRLGKLVVECKKVNYSWNDKAIINDLTWSLGPGERIAILGENGCGKSTLLDLIRGEIHPNAGSIRLGKTVHIATLTQRLGDLEQFEDDFVREVLQGCKSTYVVDGREQSPSQLLENLGFEKGHLNTKVRDLSGGQRRRLQLLIVLLKEPNVLILDEPGNDMDTDMLALLEDLLDTWPGSLILVSHDRYLCERATSDQYGLIDGKLVHMPCGVDEFLEILESRDRNSAEKPSGVNTTALNSAKVNGEHTKQHGVAINSGEARSPKLSSGEIYQLKKEMASLERRITTAAKKRDDANEAMLEVDPSNYEMLIKAQGELNDLHKELESLEFEWLEISEKLEP